MFYLEVALSLSLDPDLCLLLCCDLAFSLLLLFFKFELDADNPPLALSMVDFNFYSDLLIPHSERLFSLIWG